jgi:glycosyltransferase involved in cell wall biosynthesis
VIFGTAARISPDKRLEDLLAAFQIAHASLPAYELHVAGRIENGVAAYARTLREEARGLPVSWRGELAGTAGFLEELDVFVMISEPAGCPNASLEALAAGLPVIATDVGGAREQVIDGVTGLLTPRRDAAALARALVKLAHDAEARVRFGVAGRERVGVGFSLERMADEYAALGFGGGPRAVVPV